MEQPKSILLDSCNKLILSNNDLLLAVEKADTADLNKIRGTFPDIENHEKTYNQYLNDVYNKYGFN